MTRAVILVAQNYQDEEFVFPYYRMLEEGWTVDVASPDGKERFGKYGVPAKVNKSTSGLLPDDYDAVVIPGGFESPDRLRTVLEVLAFVNAMHSSQKLVAAICHGGWVLISAGVVKNRRVAGYESIYDDLLNAGAIYPADRVAVDGNLITARHYKDNGPWMKAVIAWQSHESVRKEYLESLKRAP